MRFLVATLVLSAGLAAGGDARAQNVSDPAAFTIDCAGDAAATNVEGEAVPAVVPEPTPAPPLDSGLCSDARDPRCAPLTPNHDGPSPASLGELPRFMEFGSVALPLGSYVILPVPDPLAIARVDGPIGVRRDLERPPRAA